MEKIFNFPIDSFMEKTTSEIHSKINEWDCISILNDAELKSINWIVSRYKVDSIYVDFKNIEFTSKSINAFDSDGNHEDWTTYKFKVPFKGDGNLLNYYSNKGRGTISPYYVDGNYIVFESVNFDLEYNPLNRNNRIEILKNMIENLNKDYENWNNNLKDIVENQFTHRKEFLIKLKNFCREYGISKKEIEEMEFKLSALEALSQIIASIHSGSEITTLFKKAGFPEIVHDGTTKWRFICKTFEDMQNESIEGFYKILKVLEVVCDPQEYFRNPEIHGNILEEINTILSFYGFKFNEEGILKKLDSINTTLKTPISKVHNDDGEHYDVFISHSSSDKDWVNELYECLYKTDLRIWYDIAIIRIGDNIREKINDGLTKSDYGIVVLSKEFINRPWPKMEFDALLPLIDEGRLLPINHGLTNEELEQFFKPLLNIQYLSSDKYSIMEISDEIYSKIRDT